MRNTGKRYTEDFKKMIVEVYDTGKPKKEICDEYGITAASVTNWMNKVRPRGEISKKPIAIFTRENGIYKENNKEGKRRVW